MLLFPPLIFAFFPPQRYAIILHFPLIIHLPILFQFNALYFHCPFSFEVGLNVSTYQVADPKLVGLY